jgi:hypothetical protein
MPELEERIKELKGKSGGIRAPDSDGGPWLHFTPWRMPKLQKVVY